MDASNEFRFISPNTAPKKAKKMKCVQAIQGKTAELESAGGGGTELEEEDRSVPVCIANSNRNVKLRFVWDKAFKLFQSHRTVYRALSGINYQDCNRSSNSTGGGGSRGVSELGSISRNNLLPTPKHSHHNLLSRRSMSHSNLYFNGEGQRKKVGGEEVRMPGSIGPIFSSTSTWAKSGIDHDEEQEELGRKQDLFLSEEILARRRIRSRVGGRPSGCDCGSSSCNNIANSSWTTTRRNKRPVSISGGEKPQGEDEEKRGGDGQARAPHKALQEDRGRGEEDEQEESSSGGKQRDAAAVVAAAQQQAQEEKRKRGTLDVELLGVACKSCSTGNNPHHPVCEDSKRRKNLGRVTRLQKAVQLRRTQSARTPSAPTLSCHSQSQDQDPESGEDVEDHLYDQVAGDRSSASYCSVNSNPRNYCSSSSYGSRDPSPYPEYSYIEAPPHPPSGESNGPKRSTTRVFLTTDSADEYCTCDEGEHFGSTARVNGNLLTLLPSQFDVYYGNDSGLDTWKTPTSTAKLRRTGRGEEYFSDHCRGGGDEQGEQDRKKCGSAVSEQTPSSQQHQTHKPLRPSQPIPECQNPQEASSSNAPSSTFPNQESSIVCTISQKIPPATTVLESKFRKHGHHSDPSPKMDQQKCVKPRPGTTTVLLTSDTSASPHPEAGNSDSSSPMGLPAGQDLLVPASLSPTSPSDGLFLSDFDLECMSEIDLNSDDSSNQDKPSSAKPSATNNPNSAPPGKMKFHNNRSPLMKTSGFRLQSMPLAVSEQGLLGAGVDNELDSLDLTLFERGGNQSCSQHHRQLPPHPGKDKSFMEAMAELGGMDKIMMDDAESHVYDTLNQPSTLPRDSIYWNWSDAGSEFEFMSPPKIINRDIPMGHSPRGIHPDVDWEPYFCVLNQLDQTFTAYRSEEMSIFPGTPTRPRTQSVFGENGLSPTEVPRVRLDGGPNSVKCLINNSKWGMNPVLEEEEEGVAQGNTVSDRDKNKSSDNSTNGSNQILRNSSPCSPLDTSYDKACGSEQRRSSAPLTPLLGGRETPSRFVNFFSKRSFKSNPLKRTKSVTKLERKKPIGMEPESNNILYPSRLRTSRSHESLLAWTTNPQALNNMVNAGMMTTVDLTAGDVGVRPLHPSILGQHYAFQVITPSGSKYMSCSSAAERNAWVHAIRQAIKPHQDEIRRQENSLKIWILEAKGMTGGSGKHSKRFFCELYLDDVLYARTCAKPKGEMLFWGEHFEFSQLPNVQLITVVFFREGDKKRKKERNTCIGKVKIPVNTVNSRSLIEKWYPVVPDAGSSQTLSKDQKDGPSLRIKCKFQSVDILPLRCYKTFLQYVKDEYGPVCESLENVLSVKAKEDLANAMVHVLHHEGLAKEFIAELALQEILKSGDEKLTFRGNSIATKAMEAFLKLTGTEYLHATLGPFIEQFQNAEDVHDCEIDPMKLPQASSGTLRKNQQHLRTAIDIVWKSILHSHNGMFPIELRECFVHCREALKSAGKEELSDHLISASIFLRFLCPAILSPSLFNITNEYPSEKSARNLTLVAKVLQTLANFTRFQGKESYMEFINDFVEKEAPNMKAFLSQISSPLSPEVTKKLQMENQDKVPAGGFIDLGKYLSILSTLLGESVSKIAPKNDRFKQLQDIVENIHWWLKQPANATNVSVFPFPHVTSPPPNVPPPPAPIGLHNIPGNHQRIISAATSHTNPLALNHQYQVPHQNMNVGFTVGSANSSPKSPQPIYAVSGVIHNTQNPNVKNISQIQIPPLQLQIPSINPGLNLSATTPSGNNNISGRSGSQASSGYQSQSPVLEGSDEKSKKASTEHYMNVQRNLNGNRNDLKEVPEHCPNGFKNGTARKCNSQSVDDLSSFGVNSNENSGFKKRLTRSSSSSDCEYPPAVMPSKSTKSRSSQQKFYSPSNSQMGSISGVKMSHGKPKIVSTPHHRLNRRSSAELLRKNHPYSTSTDEDSDSCHNVSERSDISGAPQLPPRRGHLKRNVVGPRPNPDGSVVLSSSEEKPLDEVRLNARLLNASLQSADARDCTKYEKEMIELRRAMEALQLKLNRAEERLFGHDSPTNQSRRESDVFIPRTVSPISPNNNSNGSGRDRVSLKSVDEDSLEMDHLLQRLLSAEEEMKREQELLTALDRKQKLIEAQEQKIARLDAVNNQLLEALAQIRDSLQQQHVQAQQQKVQMQLQKQQQQLQSLSNSMLPLPASPQHNRNAFNSSVGRSLQNINLQKYQAPNPYTNNAGFDYVLSRGQQNMGDTPPPPVTKRTKPSHNNTTKVLITSDSSSDNSSPLMSLEDTCSYSSNPADDFSGNNNMPSVNSSRDSTTFVAENALKMLAELKSSSC